MNIILLGTSFLAGILTIAAPCVLPVLPVIIGSTAGSKNRLKPFIVATSLALSVVIFTLLLKASSVLINVPQSFWMGLSGGIILLFGFFLLIPEAWQEISYRLKLGRGSQATLAKAGTGESLGSAILIGGALGPVFASCSPTYFVILATVLPASFIAGITYLLIYALGLMIAIGLIGYFGQRLISKLGWAADPKGWFRRILGLLLILVGLAIITGFDKTIQTAVLEAGYGVTSVEENLLEDAIGEDPSRPQSDRDGTSLPYLYRAPELTGLNNWINSEPIESMRDLRGKVVLVDFWTYSCINCIRTLPYLQAWHERYADEGLVILGVHAPEFQFEKKIENVRGAVDEFGLTYAVVQDNDFTLWRAYNNHYWPAKYIIDGDGIVRYTHFGEGQYEETESVITELLRTTVKAGEVEAEAADFGQIDTRETYIGLDRRSNFVKADRELRLNEWTLIGEWQEDEERAVTQAPKAAIKMRFRASKANLVIDGVGSAEVFIDGKPANEDNSGADVSEGRLKLDGARLYELTDFGPEYTEHEIEVRFLTTDVAIFAWTFG